MSLGDPAPVDADRRSPRRAWLPVILPLVAAPAVLLGAAWLDHVALMSIQRQVGTTFDPTPATIAVPLALIASASASLGLAVLAWRSRSAVVGLVYVVVGAYLTFQVFILFRLAASINGAPPVLPAPVADLVGQVSAWSSGPTDAVSLIGAVMLVTGVAVLGRWVRSRSSGRQPRPDRRSLDEPAEPVVGPEIVELR